MNKFKTFTFLNKELLLITKVCGIGMVICGVGAALCGIGMDKTKRTNFKK